MPAPRIVLAAREWTYPIAQAAFFYLGGKRIAAALRADDAVGLAKDLGEIPWDKLRAFIGESSRSGSAERAYWVWDGPMATVVDGAHRRVKPEAMHALGFVHDERWTRRIAKRMKDRSELGVHARVAEKLSEAARTGALAFVCDGTEKMKEPLSYVAWLRDVHAPDVLDLSDQPARTQFVAKWLAGLSAHAAPQKVQTWVVGSVVEASALPRSDLKPPASLGALLRMLRSNDLPAALIVCLGSWDATAYKTLADAARIGMVRGMDVQETRDGTPLDESCPPMSNDTSTKGHDPPG